MEMFGRNSSNETVMGSPTVQNPSALDNVASPASSTQSVITPTNTSSTSTDSAQTTQAASPSPSSPFSVSSPSIPADVVESVEKTDETPTISHPITSDNPFAQGKSQSVESDSAEDPLVSSQDTESAAITSAVDALTQSASSVGDTPLGPVSSNAGPVMPPHLSQTSSPASTSSASSIQGVSFAAQSTASTTADDTSDNSVATPKNEEYLEQLTTDETLADKVTSIPIDKVKLADMKKQALDHLEPLTEHLGGTPEETFKTTMMMIQANDNHTLLEKALEAAQKIEDDKMRAQALLDIINEINYFSQNADQ